MSYPPRTVIEKGVLHQMVDLFVHILFGQLKLRIDSVQLGKRNALRRVPFAAGHSAGRSLFRDGSLFLEWTFLLGR